LGSNKIQDAGVRIVVKVLLEKPKLGLTSLNLSDNLITSEGCKVICTLIDRSRYLDDLQMQNNEIDNDGANRLISSLKKRRLA